MDITLQQDHEPEVLTPSVFPPELYDRIIDFLWNDPLALEACSLTCRSWRPRTRYRLHMIYSQVIYAKRGYHRLLDKIHEFPDIASHIRRLVIGRRTVDETRHPVWVNCVPIQLSPLLSNLFSLEYQNTLSSLWMHPFAHAHLALFRTVGNLSLRGSTFANFNDLARLLLAFPALVYLTLESVTWKSPSILRHVVGKSRSRRLRLQSFALISSPWARGDTTDLLLWLSSTPSVSTITLFSFTPSHLSDFDGLPTFLQASKSLERLEISTEHFGDHRTSLTSGTEPF